MAVSSFSMTIRRACISAALLLLVATPGWAQPGPATLIAPAADVASSTIAFTWQSVTGSTWYHFWLGRADGSLVLEQWYTAEHAGCAGGGACTMTLTPPLHAGSYVWHIRTWGPSGYGAWSTAHLFTLKDLVQAWSGTLPPSRRFSLVLNNEGVLDNETALVWQRTPMEMAVQWNVTQSWCGTASTGGRGGWRMPTLAELRSLVDFSRMAPSLPAGHPFVLSATLTYWTSTRSTNNTNLLFVSNFSNQQVSGTADQPDILHNVWCVRGGQSPLQ
jgi:hypothetical protein